MPILSAECTQRPPTGAHATHTLLPISARLPDCHAENSHRRNDSICLFTFSKVNPPGASRTGISNYERKDTIIPSRFNSPAAQSARNLPGKIEDGHIRYSAGRIFGGGVWVVHTDRKFALNPIQNITHFMILPM